MSEKVEKLKKLKKIEKETHVHFDEHHLLATVSTYNPKWINRFKKYGIEPIEVDDTGMHTYKDIPAHWMIPKRPPQRTEAQIQASKENMKRLLANSSNGDTEGNSDDGDVSFGEDDY